MPPVPPVNTLEIRVARLIRNPNLLDIFDCASLGKLRSMSERLLHIKSELLSPIRGAHNAWPFKPELYHFQCNLPTSCIFKIKGNVR